MTNDTDEYDLNVASDRDEPVKLNERERLLVAAAAEAGAHLIASGVARIIHSPAKPKSSDRFDKRGGPLTHRELEVLQLLAAGYSNKEAGRHLEISHRTVEVHRRRLMEKLEAKTTGQLIARAIEAGLISKHDGA